MARFLLRRFCRHSGNDLRRPEECFGNRLRLHLGKTKRITSCLRECSLAGPSGACAQERDSYEKHNTRSSRVFPPLVTNARRLHLGDVSAPPPTTPEPARPVLVGWDLRHAGRAAGIALVTFLLVVVATALTDEGGVAWSVRLGRALPVVPLCAALGTYVATARRRTRSEMLGLAGLGRSPQANAFGATLGGALVAWGAAAMLFLAPSIDVGGFYPSVVRAAEIRFDASDGGSFVLPRRGVRVLGDGALAPWAAPGPLAPEDGGGIPSGGRAAAALVTLFAGTALALVASTLRQGSRRRIVLSAAVVLPLTVLFFHAAAAHRASPYLAGLPPLALLVHAALRYRTWGWELGASR